MTYHPSRCGWLMARRLAGALALGCLLLLAAGCRGTGLEDVTIQEGGAVTLASGDHVAFDKVDRDSRCPRGVSCPWAGVAVANLALHDAHGSTPFSLELPGGMAAADTLASGFGGFKPVTVGRYRVTLLQLDPYPVAGTDPLAVQSAALIRVEY